mmetsp:Transcript_31451/g.78930  ORF Transcript_31451/g.78930 Transcript_31451/m.78930 type:complete len:152 (-) Transcript_31451:223-678(-)
MLVAAGFQDVRVEEKAESREFIKDWMPGSGAEDFVVSANVTAFKPRTIAADTKPPATDTEAPVTDKTNPATDATLSDLSTASASAAALFATAAGVSLAAAGPVGRAVGELVAAIGGVVRTVTEHHGRHTDDTAPGSEMPSPEPAEEKKAGC